jgi:hypothetical protein
MGRSNQNVRIRHLHETYAVKLVVNSDKSILIAFCGFGCIVESIFMD